MRSPEATVTGTVSSIGNVVKVLWKMSANLFSCMYCSIFIGLILAREPCRWFLRKCVQLRCVAGQPIGQLGSPVLSVSGGPDWLEAVPGNAGRSSTIVCATVRGYCKVIAIQMGTERKRVYLHQGGQRPLCRNYYTETLDSKTVPVNTTQTGPSQRTGVAGRPGIRKQQVIGQFRGW
ncbi:UNVERIFIED_CONTAM: hypothetical protein FKN15_016372 [Acipenser sinensis]